MSQRNSYNDTRTGEADKSIRLLLNGNQQNIRSKILLNIIKNELTERQKEIFMLYYFKGRSMPEIANMQNISVQSVSKTIARARKKIYDFMKYYFL